MQSRTPRQTRASRSRGTHAHRPSAALTSSVPPNFQSSTTGDTYGSQSSAESITISSQIEQAEAPHLRQHEPDAPTEEENDEQYVEPGPSSQPPGRICQSKFPYQLCKMIEDKQMEDYIRWDAPHVFQVLNIEGFEKNALPEYFPRMKDWTSFHRQLSNYGLEKQDRGSPQPKFAHWNKKFCQGGEELLSEVLPRPKQHTTSTPQAVVQAQPPIPYAPSFPGPIPPPHGQVDLNVRLSQLENMILELKKGCMHQSARESRLLAKEKRLLAREKLLLARETRLLTRETRLATREKRLTSRENRLSARERRVEREFQLQELSSEQPSISPEADLLYPIDQTGSAGAALDQDSDMCEARDSLDAYSENACTPEIGTTDGGNVQDVFSRLETETTLGGADSTPVIGPPPRPQPSSSLSPTGITPSYANEQQDSEEHRPGSSGLDETLAAWHYSHFNPFSGIWWQNSSAAAPTSPGSKIPVAQVPSPSLPGFGRCR